MIRKAGDSIECAQTLHTVEQFDGTANRAYYAAYQAAWHFLVATGQEVPGTHWRHNQQILDALENADIRPFDGWQEAFDLLQNQRMKADYTIDHVEEDKAGQLVEHAQAFVNWMRSNAPN